MAISTPPFRAASHQAVCRLIRRAHGEASGRRRNVRLAEGQAPIGLDFGAPTIARIVTWRGARVHVSHGRCARLGGLRGRGRAGTAEQKDREDDGKKSIAEVQCISVHG